MGTTNFALTAALTAFVALVTRPARAIAPPPYAHHVCPNGLEVIVVERHSVPLVTIEVAVHTGSMSEPPEYSGLSHLFEHMFFKGNKAMPDQLAYSARVRELGYSLLLGGDWHITKAFADRVRQTTPEDVRRVARKWLSSPQTAIVGDPSKLDPKVVGAP